MTIEKNLAKGIPFCKSCTFNFLTQKIQSFYFTFRFLALRRSVELGHAQKTFTITNSGLFFLKGILRYVERIKFLTKLTFYFMIFGLWPFHSYLVNASDIILLVYLSAYLYCLCTFITH